jgi:Asp/Glu/hydantoin racemase
MKIWHQSFTVLGQLGAYEEGLRKHFARVAHPGTEIVLHGMHPGTYRSNYPGEDIRHAALQYLHSLQFFAAGLQAQEEGYDAFAVSTLPEPGLRELRSMLVIPVLGYGESAMLGACQLGRRFGVLVFIAELAPLIDDNARRLGLEARYAGARDVGFRFNDVLAAYAAPASLLERFRAAARALIAQGADVIIPGEAPLCVLLAAQRVTEVDGVPVMDPLSAWVKDAEKLVDLRAQSGIRGSRRGYFHEPPSRERLKELASFYGLDKFRHGKAT